MFYTILFLRPKLQQATDRGVRYRRLPSEPLIFELTKTVEIDAATGKITPNHAVEE